MEDGNLQSYIGDNSNVSVREKLSFVGLNWCSAEYKWLNLLPYRCPMLLVLYHTASIKDSEQNLSDCLFQQCTIMNGG